MRENRSENSEIYAEDISFSTKIILFWKILIGKSKKDNVGDSRAQRCGKTTLSYLVLGLLKPSKGVVHNYIKSRISSGNGWFL